MKNIKLYLYFILLLSSINLSAQQVNKKTVVLEIITGTWCYYCPGAALGAEDLIAKGKNVAVIVNHDGDDFTNATSDIRNSFYSPSTVPASYFDGIFSGCGGNHSESIYNCYLPLYNSTISQLTSFDINMNVETTDNINFNITVTIDKVANYSGTNLVAHLAITESNIEYEWQEQTKLHWVNRQMYPSASGTNLDFSDNLTQTLQYTVVADSEWEIENCEFVAFIQDNTNKYIPQAIKYSLNPNSIVNNITNSDVVVYPNPASTSVYINTINNVNIENVSIFDITGKLVFAQKYNNKKGINIDIEKLYSGFYIIKIKTEDNNLTRKITIIK